MMDRVFPLRFLEGVVSKYEKKNVYFFTEVLNHMWQIISHLFDTYIHKLLI